MIGKLRGIIDYINEDSLIIDVNGVGYVVFVTSTIASQAVAGNAISLFIETHVREDHIHLYGFESRAQQDMFLTLIKVQGVGARMSLNILSVFDAEQVSKIILAEDKVSLTRVSGVGKRIAERIVTELKNKLPSLSAILSDSSVTQRHAAPLASSALSDAVSALEHLGYARVHAMQAAQAAIKDGADTLDAIIPLALQHLATS
jgi:holliday junction DNA helicase RuvA